MNRRFNLALLFAILLDIADFTIGWIPIAGDVLDVLGILILLLLIGKYALIPAIELIPLADFLPMFTVAVIMARSQAKGKEAWK